MKLNIKKLQKAGTIPLKQDYQFYKGQYDPELKAKIQARAEANKPVNTTSEFIYDFKTKRAMPNPNAKMGLEIVSPEFQLMTAGVGSLGTKAVSTAGKIGQTMLHGAGQGAMANMSNLSGSEQNLEGLATDVLGGVIVGGALKGVGIGAKAAKQNAYKINPWAFKPNPKAYYRGVGKEGLDDILESGIIRSKKRHAYPEPYFSKGLIGDKYAKGYFAELTNEPMKGVGSFSAGDLIQTPVDKISINNPNLKLYKKH